MRLPTLDRTIRIATLPKVTNPWAGPLNDNDQENGKRSGSVRKIVGTIAYSLVFQIMVKTLLFIYSRKILIVPSSFRLSLGGTVARQ